MSDISVNYMGLKLSSPIIAASSGLTAQLNRIKEFESEGVGAIVVKSLFEEQIVNEAQFLSSQSQDYPESADYLHHYLRQNSIERYLQLLTSIRESVSLPIIASINCYSPGEWTSFAKEIEGTGVDGLELNIYSLPLDIYKSSNEVEKGYLEVVEQISKVIKIPIAVKIASTFTNLPAFVNGLKAHGAKAVVMFNRFYSPDIDIDKVRLFPADAFSKPEESLRELRWMGILSALVTNLDFSANTGIHNGTLAIKQILAGAKTIQMCTALYKRGAVAISQANADIALFMESKGFKSIEEFRGKLNYANIENPGKFERVQFMKSFGDLK